MWYKENREKYIEEKEFIKTYNKRNKSSLKINEIHNRVIISGKLHFKAIFKNELIEDEYNIEIYLPEEYPEEFPLVREIDNKINKSYHHSYIGGMDDRFLCLATDSELSLKFSTNPCLKNFFKCCLIPYLYNHSYKMKYKKSPEMEERSHGIHGILEFYYNYFDVKTPEEALKLLYQFFNMSKITEQTKCPCGSNLSLLCCHYSKLDNLNRANVKHIYSDLSKIEREYPKVCWRLKTIAKLKSNQTI